MNYLFSVTDSHTQLLTGLVAILLTVCSVVFLAGCLCCHRRNGFKVWFINTRLPEQFEIIGKAFLNVA